MSFASTSPKRFAQFLGGDRASGVSGSNGVVTACAQAEQPLGQAVRAAQQPLDRGEVEAVGLQVEDQPQPRDVLGAVVADARAHLRRGQQAAGVVVADVAHRHADLGGELLDRQVVAGAGRDCVGRCLPIGYLCASLGLASLAISRFKGTTFHVPSFEVTLSQVVMSHLDRATINRATTATRTRPDDG